MKPLGRHLILELLECPAGLLSDPDHVAKVMTRAVELCGATLVQPFFHQFAPQGVSGVIIISESHFTIHTWPEYGYAAVDVFTCGDSIDLPAAVQAIKQGFEAKSIWEKVMIRGVLAEKGRGGEEMVQGQHSPVV